MTGDMHRTNPEEAMSACPQCGRELSSWEQVLLSVDRALICKGCWYHILLNLYDDLPSAPPAAPSDRRTGRESESAGRDETNSE